MGGEAERTPASERRQRRARLLPHRHTRQAADTVAPDRLNMWKLSPSLAKPIELNTVFKASLMAVSMTHEPVVVTNNGELGCDPLEFNNLLIANTGHKFSFDNTGICTNL